MRRRDFLRAVGGGATLLATGGLAAAARRGAPRPAPAKKRPNILWLISESTSTDLACYGNVHVKTPNLDQLADEGAMFTHAFATAPVSSPSRSAFMTGMYQTSIGAQNHPSHRDDGYRLPEPVQVITEYFRQAGYFTCNADGLSYKKPGKTDWNFATARPAFDGMDWSERKEGQPFFAQVNFNLTGRPFENDKRHPIDSFTTIVPSIYPNHPVARRDWADYLEAIQVLDTQVGVVLTWLEKESLANDTIVVYSSDYGRPHVRCEQWLYDGGLRVPLLVRWPDHIEGGSVYSGLVSTIDLAPTLLALAEIPIPKHLQGYTILGPQRRTREYIFAARDRCDETIDRVRCVRSQRYKYIRNYFPDKPYTQFNGHEKLWLPMLTLLQVQQKAGALTPPQALFMAPAKPQEELYDLANDPLELVNVVEERAHKSARDEHRRKLDQWIKATGDQGEKPESASAVIHWQQEAAAAFRQTMKERGLPTDVSDENHLKWWEEELQRRSKAAGSEVLS